MNIEMIFEIIESGNDDLTLAVIDQFNMNINEKGKGGYTALHIAVRAGSYKTAASLIK